MLADAVDERCRTKRVAGFLVRRCRPERPTDRVGVRFADELEFRWVRSGQMSRPVLLGCDANEAAAAATERSDGIEAEVYVDGRKLPLATDLIPAACLAVLRDVIKFERCDAAFPQRRNPLARERMDIAALDVI